MIKIKNELVRFALMFSILIMIFLVIFYFTFPYYRVALRYVVDGLFGLVGMDVQYPERVMLDFMPYVSLSALILATPKRALKEKIKFVILVSILFFFIDVMFSILQISFSVYGSQILLVQEFLVISLPIVFWWYFSHSVFSLENFK